MEQPSRPAIMPNRQSVQPDVCGEAEGPNSQCVGPVRFPIVDFVGSDEKGTGTNGPSGHASELGRSVEFDRGKPEAQVYFFHGGRRYGRQLALRLRMELAQKAREKENGHVFHIANITECQPSTH